MRTDEGGNPCPATLGEYRDLCAAIGGGARGRGDRAGLADAGTTHAAIDRREKFLMDDRMDVEPRTTSSGRAPFPAVLGCGRAAHRRACPRRAVPLPAAELDRDAQRVLDASPTGREVARARLVAPRAARWAGAKAPF